jgi:predicted nucleotidyltransferase
MGTERSHIGTVSERIVEVVSSRGDVVAVYLFGSLVNGPHTPESDVDIAILFARDVGKMEQLALQQELSDRLGVEVDLVDLARAPVVLRMQVLRKGRKLFDRNPSVTTSLIVRTLFEYDDLKRIIKPIEDSILRGRIYG